MNKDYIVCRECLEEVQFLGEDSLTWCDSCQTLEGDTKTIDGDEDDTLQTKNI